MPHCVERLSIIFAMLLKPSTFEEAGCAVCGALTLQTKLSDLTSLNIDLECVEHCRAWFYSKRTKISAEPISELDAT